MMEGQAVKCQLARELIHMHLPVHDMRYTAILPSAASTPPSSLYRAHSSPLLAQHMLTTRTRIVPRTS
jgi:hypothetical protein